MAEAALGCCLGTMPAARTQSEAASQGLSHASLSSLAQRSIADSSAALASPRAPGLVVPLACPSQVLPCRKGKDPMSRYQVDDWSDQLVM